MAWAVELIGQYGYFAIFFLLAIGILGLPVPDEALVVFAGYLCSILVLNVLLTVLTVIVGSISGMTVSYFIGKKWGHPLANRYGKWIGLTPGRLEKVRGWYSRFGVWTVLFTCFIPGIRHVTSYISGISAIPFRKYMIICVVGTLAWVMLFITLGYFAGHSQLLMDRLIVSQ